MSEALTAAVLRCKAISYTARIRWHGEPENVCGGISSALLLCPPFRVLCRACWFGLVPVWCWLTLLCWLTLRAGGI